MKSKKKKLSIGVSDFKELITDNLYFVDKSLFIQDVVDGVKVLLYPRPRRFGKTLNLSMLRYFYDNSEDNAHLFKDLAIANENDIMQKQGKHPVIFITFKDAKGETAEECYRKIGLEISKLYSNHEYLLNQDFMADYDIDYYNRIMSEQADFGDMNKSLQKLCIYLYKHHKINPVVLIDEYDTPIHEAFYNGYYNTMVSFMKTFLGGALKDNRYLEKGVLTGILRVSKESMFSDLNNISVYSLLNERSNDKFGFTESEVEKLLDDYDNPVLLNEVREMYNGYNIGSINIYNPWSLLKCVEEKQLSTYWINTSSNHLIKDMCKNADISIKNDLELLLEGGKLLKYISENIVFADLETDEKSLWSFFVMCGYLRYDRDDNESKYSVLGPVNLSIPNKEIRIMFNDIITKHWFKKPEQTDKIINMAYLLTEGDLNEFEKEFIEYCHETFSYFDIPENESEKLYHMFVLSMLICLKNKYIIRSNRESGYGRVDIMMIPTASQNVGNVTPTANVRNVETGLAPDLSPFTSHPSPLTPHPSNRRGIIFEFKKLTKIPKETFEIAFRSARRQIEEKNYEREMKAYGVDNIVKIIIVFDGKNVKMEMY
jgi:hypothetical protein